MHHFGMELHGVQLLLSMSHGGYGAVLGSGNNLKALRHLIYMEGMAHPAICFGMYSVKQFIIGVQGNFHLAVFPAQSSSDFSIQRNSH
jgi:hypothetical protein